MMKLPKKLIIAGVEYEVIPIKNQYGGKFECAKQKMWIGIKGRPDFQFQVLLHEVIEAVITERNHRYALIENPREENYLFSFNHAEFTNIIKDVALALKELVKNP